MIEYSLQVFSRDRHPRLIACLGCFIEDKEDSTMTDLYVHPEFRGRGIAISMMWHLYEVLQRSGVQRVEWSDCSDRYRQPGNLYLRIGAHYVHPDSDPSMVWDLTKVSKWPDDMRPLRLTRDFHIVEKQTYINKK